MSSDSFALPLVVEGLLLKIRYNFVSRLIQCVWQNRLERGINPFFDGRGGENWPFPPTLFFKLIFGSL